MSGGVKGAVAGTLAIMIGGDAALAQRLDALLAVMGGVCTLAHSAPATLPKSVIKAAGVRPD